PPAHAIDLPGPVRVPRPAVPSEADGRGAADHPPHRRLEGRTAPASARRPGPGGTVAPGALRGTVPPRAFGRPAATGGYRIEPGPRARTPRGRRARVDAGRVGWSRHPLAAGRASKERAGGPDDQPRPLDVSPLRRPHRGH